MKFSDYLPQLYDYHYWATRRVVAAAEALMKEQLHQPQPNSYSSIHGLLVHLMGAEWIWLQRSQGNSPTVLPSTSEFPTLEALKERWAALEVEMREFIAAQTDESLEREVHYTTTSGKPFHMALWQMLVHAANHGTHHRGELAEMFARIGVPHEEDDLNQYFLMQSGRADAGLAYASLEGLQMKAWKTNARRVLLSQPPWLVVEHHSVELPDGRVIEDWPWVITPDYINVVAQTEEERFLCFRQVKYGIAGPTLALVGGYLQPGEDPLHAAQRELREETGYAAPEWTGLGHYLVDPNRGIATGHLYLARQARKVTERDADDLEEQHLVHLTRSELEAALEGGEFKVLAWAAAVAFALRRLS